MSVVQLPARIQATFGGAEAHTPVKEVGIVGNDDEVMVPGVAPERFIVVGGQAEGAYMVGVGVDRNEYPDKACGKVVSEEEFHAAVEEKRRRSRAAAKARQAAISSSRNSGKFARIAAVLLPEARESRISATARRIPRMQGLPLRLPGSMVIG